MAFTSLDLTSATYFVHIDATGTVCQHREEGLHGTGRQCPFHCLWQCRRGEGSGWCHGIKVQMFWTGICNLNTVAPFTYHMYAIALWLWWTDYTAAELLNYNILLSLLQTCVCANRMLVQEGIHDKFVEGLVKASNALKVGDGFVEGTTQGPLINARGVKKVQASICITDDIFGKSLCMHTILLP